MKSLPPGFDHAPAKPETRRRASVRCFGAVVGTALLVACGTADRNPLAKGNGPEFSDAGVDGALDICVAENAKAQRAMVDIILIIDGSGSMLEETDQVQQNLNAFADWIGKTGLDYQVLMLADKRYKMPFPIGPYTEAGICVPPPLGGPNCGDNPPKFRFVGQGSDSTTSLQLILSTYPSWKQYLRLPAYKVFIDITDDESSMAWQVFDTSLLGQQPAGMFGDAVNRRYIFDSICGWQDGSPPLAGQKCATADNAGTNYQHLSQLTHGTIDSVCKTSYASVFDNLAKGLSNMLGCTFSVPQPSSGVVDPTAVVVKYTPAGASEATSLIQVTDATKCTSFPEGWYYDDNARPTAVNFCPGLCNTIGADTAAKLDIAMGCKGAPPR
jgi:hypothetical protein